MIDIEVTVTDSDQGFDDLFDRLETLGEFPVTAGLYAELGQIEVDKGMWHEFGTRDMPARPWLSVAADAGREEFASVTAELVGDVCDGASPRRALHKLGKTMAAAAFDTIWAGRVQGPALAPATLEQPNATPIKLLDTGDMIESITYAIDEKVERPQ